MNEKTYKTIGNVGVMNLVIAIILLAVSVTSSILLIVSSVNIHKRRSDIII